MWDPLNQRSPTGGYPWRIENTSTTKIYIKNITDREQYYVTHLNWENGGEYMLGMKKLLPRQTIEIDIRQLRDNQTPDEAGRIIPSYVEKGQLKWSLKRTTEVSPAEEVREALAVIGRTEQIDVINGISSNYACQNCCGDSYNDSYITPSSVEIEVDGQVDFDVYQQDRDCYGVPTGYYRRTPWNGSTSWSSNNTSVATVNNSIARGLAAGNSTISATWTDFNNMMGLPCGPYFTESGEQCTSEKEELPQEQVKGNELQQNLSPPCGGCESHAIRPRPTAYLLVKPPRVTNVTAEPTQDVKRVNQVVGNSNIFHFVTPKGDANSQVTLTATITPNNQRVLNDIDWEGATESPTNPLQATVSRSSASKNVVKIKYRGTVLKELRVWIVWATITSTDTGSTIFNTQTGNPLGQALGIKGGYNFTHTIQPAEIITDSDRPNFSGANVNSPPGGNHPIQGTSLSGGADKKWDNSRQIRFKILNPNNINIRDTAFFQKRSVPADVLNYPANDVEGNDDTTTGDETNDPYSNNKTLTGFDEPVFALCHRAGVDGDTYEQRLHFREFTRLEIEGTWYRISDFYLWRIHLKFEKVNGLWEGIGSSKALDNTGF